MRRLVWIVLALMLVGGVVSPAGAAVQRVEDQGRPSARAGVAARAPSRIHPGAYVGTDQGFCTLNFLFKGSDGRNYIATAGHCVLSQAGHEVVWPAGAGPVAEDAAGNRFGEFAYAQLHNNDSTHPYIRDFALIRLDRETKAHPAVPQFGGPTGINDDASSQPTLIHYYGQGMAISDAMPGRSAVSVRGTRDPHEMFAVGPINLGDSGGPVITDDGRAVGVITNVGGFETNILSPEQSTDAGTIVISRLPSQIDSVQSALGISLQLRTAKYGG